MAASSSVVRNARRRFVGDAGNAAAGAAGGDLRDGGDAGRDPAAPTRRAPRPATRTIAARRAGRQTLGPLANPSRPDGRTSTADAGMPVSTCDARATGLTNRRRRRTGIPIGNRVVEVERPRRGDPVSRHAARCPQIESLRLRMSAPAVRLRWLRTARRPPRPSGGFAAGGTPRRSDVGRPAPGHDTRQTVKCTRPAAPRGAPRRGATRGAAGSAGRRNVWRTQPWSIGTGPLPCRVGGRLRRLDAAWIARLAPYRSLAQINGWLRS